MSKLIKKLTAMLLVGMLVMGSASGSVFASEMDADSGQTSTPSYDIYLARKRIAGYRSEKTFYNLLINSENQLVYQQLAEYAMEEKNLYYSSGLWLTYFDDIFKNCPRYAYEAILMSYLDYDADSTEVNNTMEENVNSFGIELMTMLLSSGIDDTVKEDKDALKVKNQIIALPKDEAKKVLKEKIVLEVDAGLLSGSTFASEDIPKLITNLSVLRSADKKREGQIAFLEKMQNQIKDNDDLKSALKDIVDSYKSKKVISLWNQTTKQNAYIFGKVLVSAGWDKLIENAGPEVSSVLKGIRLGGSGLNALFGTTTLSQDLMTILTLYIIDDEFKNTVRDLKDRFLQNPDEKNAVAFNTAIDAYIEYQKFADFTAKQYVYDIINSGVLTKTFTKIFYNDNIENAEELMAFCDDEIKRRNHLNDITRKYYENYCEEYHLEAYSDAYNILLEEEDVWKAIPEKKDDSDEHIISPFLSIIDDLVSRHGSLRIVQNNGDWEYEANGLCYLNLIDFTGDGEDELMAVCKNEDEENYTGYIYTIKNGSASLIFKSDQIEYNSYQAHDIVYVGQTKETGYIFGIGWEDADADDRTFFWYKDGTFKSVYRSKGYWDGELEEAVIDEEEIIVDIFDDEHREEFWNNCQEVTLRTMSDIDVNGDYFDSHKLQTTIDDTLRKLGADIDKPTTVKNNESVESSEDNNDLWKESYIDYIKNDYDISTSPEWCTCGLIYLDDDEIPELIIDYGIEALGTKIVSIKNGNIVYTTFARTGGIHYIEREGLVYNSIGHQGIMNDDLAYLDNEGFHGLGQGFRYGEEQDFINYTYFNWNNKEVSEDEYYSNINSQFDDEKSVRWNSYSDDIPGSAYRYAPDEMCEYLLEN